MLPELEVFVSKFYDFQLTLDEEVSVQVFQATVEQLDRQQLLESLVHLYSFFNSSR